MAVAVPLHESLVPEAFLRPLVLVEPGPGAARTLAAARGITAARAVFDVLCVRPVTRTWLVGVGLTCCAYTDATDWDAACDAVLREAFAALPADASIRTSVAPAPEADCVRRRLCGGEHDVVLVPASVAGPRWRRCAVGPLEQIARRHATAPVVRVD